jgi:hypothetical protein
MEDGFVVVEGGIDVEDRLDAVFGPGKERGIEKTKDSRHTIFRRRTKFAKSKMKMRIP